MSAVEELENRAVLVALSGEYVGTTPLLALLRVALDEYAAAEPGTLLRLRLVPGYELVGTRVWDEFGNEMLSAVRGALSLYRVLHSDPEEALRVLEQIENATRNLRSVRQ
jgi:hypothetical protein